METHQLLDDSQYGFRKDRSTSMALMELSEEIANCMDNKKQAVGIFIDLQKAFDTIDHNILLIKLERYGNQRGGIKLGERLFKQQTTIC